MAASHMDYAITALALWREDRGGGNSGLTAVACVIRNRVLKNHSSYFEEITKPRQFTSISVRTDPQVALFPKLSDPSWTAAQLIASNIIDNVVTDITNGATLYYAPNSIQTTAKIILPNGDVIPFPETWNEEKVRYTGTIGGQVYWREL